MPPSWFLEIFCLHMIVAKPRSSLGAIPATKI